MSNQQTKTTVIITFTAALLLLPWAASAADKQSAAKPAPSIELGAPFADNAILQREKELPVWGWSKPGTTVTVEFAGQKESAKAGADGRWMLKLKPLKASAAPAEMVIQESGDGSQGLGSAWFSGISWLARYGMPAVSPIWNG